MRLPWNGIDPRRGSVLLLHATQAGDDEGTQGRWKALGLELTWMDYVNEGSSISVRIEEEIVGFDAGLAIRNSSTTHGFLLFVVVVT